MAVDSNNIAVGGMDGTVSLYDIRNLSTSAFSTFPAHPNIQINDLTFIRSTSKNVGVKPYTPTTNNIDPTEMSIVSSKSKSFLSSTSSKVRVDPLLETVSNVIMYVYI